MKNHESAENYLETIYVLSKEKGNVKSIDVVRELGYSKPSVSVAMKNLKNAGHITVDDNGYIKLTEDGFKIATTIYERHIVISAMLERLGVDPTIAAEDACKVEHVLSEESFLAIKKYMES